MEAREEGALGGGIRPWVNLTPRVTPWRHRGVSLRSRLGREDGLLFAATLFDFYLGKGKRSGKFFKTFVQLGLRVGLPSLGFEGHIFYC